MKPKTYLLCTKRDWDAFIVLPCDAICFRQCKVLSRVGFCCCLNKPKTKGGRPPGGSGGSKMNGFPIRHFPLSNVRTPRVELHMGNIHVARVMSDFRLPRQRLDKLRTRLSQFEDEVVTINLGENSIEKCAILRCGL